MLLPIHAFSAESDDVKADENVSALELNIRRIGLDYSRTDVRYAADYSASLIQALKTSSQDFIKGAPDIVLKYKWDKLNLNWAVV